MQKEDVQEEDGKKISSADTKESELEFMIKSAVFWVEVLTI